MADEIEIDDDEIDLEWCVDCGETFRYDDCGGYNPPCVCGMHCRSCHEADLWDDDDRDDFDDEADDPAAEGR